MYADLPTGFRLEDTFSDIPAGFSAVPSSGVTIAPKGGMPREASPQEAEPYRRASLLPVALNQNTGLAEPAVPALVQSLMSAGSEAVTAPGRAYRGELQTQSVDPASGQVRTSPDAIGQGLNFGAFASPLPAAIRGGVGWAGVARPVEGPRPAAAPTTEQIKAASQAKYREAEASGLEITGESYARVANKMDTEAKALGVDPDLTPRSFAAVQRLKAVVAKQQSPDPMAPVTGVMPKPPNQKLTLEEIDRLRQVVGIARRAPEPDDRRIGGRIADELDEWLDNLKPSDIAAGDAGAAVASLKEARRLWKIQSKSEIIDQALANAGLREGQFSISGAENAIRTEFRGLARKIVKDKRFANKWTNDEKNLIKQLGNMGGATNIFRVIGKLAPNSVFTMGGGVGIGMVNPALAGAMWGAGIGGKIAATQMTKAKTRQLGQLVRSGGQTAPVTVPRNALVRGSRQGGNALMQTGVRSGFMQDY